MSLPPSGYLRGTFNVPRYLRWVAALAPAQGFAVEVYGEIEADPLIALRRPAIGPRLYVSAGMHGDEPAGSLALAWLLRTGRLPRECDLTLLPLLNPCGMRRRTRENADGVDINRDYERRSTPEARAHLAWLEGQETPYDAAICLHEDWEAHGFYVYQLPRGEEHPAREVLAAVDPVCAVDRSPEIDGSPADQGLMRPDIGRLPPGDLPEAITLARRFALLSLTLETPSNSSLRQRLQAHERAIERIVQWLRDIAPLG